MKVARISLALIITALGPPIQAAAASQDRPVDAVLGDWHGTSLCLVRPSACHDEEALYHVRLAKSDQLQLDADKIVDGKPENMGTADCAFEAPTSRLHCELPHGFLDLKLQGDHLDGAMFLTDKTRWRDIKLTRVRP